MENDIVFAANTARAIACAIAPSQLDKIMFRIFQECMCGKKETFCTDTDIDNEIIGILRANNYEVYAIDEHIYKIRW